MLKRLQFQWFTRGVASKLCCLGILAGVGLLAFFGGRQLEMARAANATKVAAAKPSAVQFSTPIDPQLYGKRVVGYVHFGGQPFAITREELGEYLIARLGPDRLDYLINKKVIEMVCTSRGITVSDEEIAKQYAEDLKGFNVPEKDFVNVLLKRRHQTLYEWKEDVIRPRLLMAKLCRGQIHVEEEEIQKAFEAKFGDKVQCRMIALSKDMSAKNRDDIYAKVRDSEVEFHKEAGKGCIPAIASKGGEIPPIHRYFPDKSVEEEAFKLVPGMVSKILELKEGDDRSYIILKCDKLLPREADRKIEDERLQLEKEIVEDKLTQLVPVAFQELRRQADPRNFLRPESNGVPPQTATQPTSSLNKATPPAAH